MVNWTAEKDQIILRGIFKFHDIKNSAPLLKYLAEEIGEGCTPKAVSHRLSGLRNKGKPTGTGSAVSTPSKTVATPKKATATPRARASATKSKKPATPVSTSDDEENEPEGLKTDAEDAETPSMARGRRTMSAPKRSYAQSDESSENSDVEDEYVPMAKRIKTEPTEEEGAIFGGGAVQSDDEIEV